jgi:hypothetical protein
MSPLLHSRPLLRAGLCALFTAFWLITSLRAQTVETVEIQPGSAEALVGESLQFRAVGKDKDGNVLEMPAQLWFAAPFDQAGADAQGNVKFYSAGEAYVGAVLGGKLAFAKVRVKPPPVERVQITPPGAPLAAGGVLQLQAQAFEPRNTPSPGAQVRWTSLTPNVALVNEAGVVTGMRPGTATIQAEVGNVKTTTQVQVIRNPVDRLAIRPEFGRIRTGDVVRFNVEALSADGAPVRTPALRWSVDCPGGSVDASGAFVAEQAGTCIVSATTGEKTAVAALTVAPRNVERTLEVVGRAPLNVHTAEQWIIGQHAYVSTISNKVYVYDVSDPAKPVRTDSLTLDAALINDISTTADGKIGVLSREGASSRKNGIMFLDLADPAHPTVLSEYTETVSGGVHSAFVDGHYVYLTDDATASMRVIDFRDPKAPKEVARWEVGKADIVDNPALGGAVAVGQYLHDVQVVDGLAYLAYWRDGLLILDVGKGLKGGSPENPQFVSQINLNYYDLYGEGWLAGAHAVYRYEDYVFIGDEVFPGNFGVGGGGLNARMPVRGIVHVIDVSDIEHPRKVAWYEVPEGGAHNIWVKDDILYMGYYTGGARVLDVSGELRGDLYRQGREIARLWTGDANGVVPNAPFCWGAQPHGDHVYFNDVNSGLWITKLGDPKFKGSTSAPGQ